MPSASMVAPTCNSGTIGFCTNVDGSLDSAFLDIVGKDMPHLYAILKNVQQIL
jgi:hypothetical protein